MFCLLSRETILRLVAKLGQRKRKSSFNAPFLKNTSEKVRPISRPQIYGTMVSLIRPTLEWSWVVPWLWHDDPGANRTKPNLASFECSRVRSIIYTVIPKIYLVAAIVGDSTCFEYTVVAYRTIAIATLA